MRHPAQILDIHESSYVTKYVHECLYSHARVRGVRAEAFPRYEKCYAMRMAQSTEFVCQYCWPVPVVTDSDEYYNDEDCC